MTAFKPRKLFVFGQENLTRKYVQSFSKVLGQMPQIFHFKYTPQPINILATALIVQSFLLRLGLTRYKKKCKII